MRLSTTLGPWPNEDARYSVSLCPCRWRHRLCRHVEPAQAGALVCAYAERLRAWTRWSDGSSCWRRPGCSGSGRPPRWCWPTGRRDATRLIPDPPQQKFLGRASVARGICIAAGQRRPSGTEYTSRKTMVGKVWYGLKLKDGGGTDDLDRNGHEGFRHLIPYS